MTRVQVALAVLIVGELVALGALAARRWSTAALPATRLELLEPGLASDIRRAEEEFAPAGPDDWIEFAELYRTFGLFAAADYCFAQAAGQEPDDPAYLYYWGVARSRMGDTAGARELFQQGLERIRPRGGAEQQAEVEALRQFCRRQLGQDYLREENLEKAEAELRQVTGPAGRAARLLLARALIRAGRVEEAHGLLDELLREAPGVIDVHLLKAQAAAASGDVAAAERYQDLALRCRGRMQLVDRAHEVDRVRRLEYGTVRSFLEAADARQRGRVEEAGRRMRDVAARMWNEDTAVELARVELRLGRADAAREALGRIIDHVGASPITLELLGDCWLYSGDEARGREAWRRAAAMHPTAALHDKLAGSLERDGDDKAAARQRALARFQRGLAAWHGNDLQSALPEFEAAVSVLPNHAHAWFYLGDTRRALGEAESAEAAYRRCLEVNPDHGRALRGLRLINHK